MFGHFTTLCMKGLSAVTLNPEKNNKNQLSAFRKTLDNNTVITSYIKQNKISVSDGVLMKNLSFIYLMKVGRIFLRRGLNLTPTFHAFHYTKLGEMAKLDI